MSVGFPQLKNDIDARAGQLALQLREVLDDIAYFKKFLDTKTLQDAIDLGYTSEEAALLLAAYADLSDLRSVALGNQTVATAKDFMANADQLTGVQ